MTKSWDPRHLDIRAFARAQLSLSDVAQASVFDRLVQDAVAPASPVHWRLQGELRPVAGGAEQVWLHMSASLSLPLACQRCLAPVACEVVVTSSVRFVADEATAAREDDASPEDVLVWSRDFDALSLIEDELIMALPLVPMHEDCSSEHVLTSSESANQPDTERPNPFAVLASLRSPKT
jgi:uncharacterized protein